MKALKITGIVTLLVGAAWWIAYQIKLSQKLIYGFKNVRFGQYRNGSLVLNMDLTVKNTTDLDVMVRGFDLDVYVNHVYVTKFFSNIESSIRPDSTAAVPLAISIKPVDVLGEIKNILTVPDTLVQMPVTLSGTIKVRKFGIPLSIPFKYTSPLKDWI